MCDLIKIMLNLVLSSYAYFTLCIILFFSLQKLHTIHNLVELHASSPVSLSKDITWDELNTERQKLKMDYMLNVNVSVRKSNSNLDEATTDVNVLEKEVDI